MSFVENIADYGKLIDGTDFTLFADCAKEMREVVSERVEERLKEIPVCFKLAGAVDASRNLGVMKTMLDGTVKIAFNLKFIDETADAKIVICLFVKAGEKIYFLDNGLTLESVSGISYNTVLEQGKQ